MRSLTLLIKLLTSSSRQLRQQWAKEICESDNFMKLMQQYNRKKDDRRMADLYEDTRQRFIHHHQ